MITSTLKIVQIANRKTSRYWGWSAWIEGTPEELDNIDEVVWRLHPTFTNPIRRINSRDTKFRLDSSGWGEFKLRAEIHQKSGPVQKLNHWVELTENEEQTEGQSIGTSATTSSSASARPRSVFVSYTKDHAPLVRPLLDALKQYDIDASIDEHVPSSVDFRRWMKEKILSSNAMVAVISNSTGVWQDAEIKIALDAGVPLIPVATEELASRVSSALSGYQSAGSLSPLFLKPSGSNQQDALDLAARIAGLASSSML
jgi:hypothetical protein